MNEILDPSHVGSLAVGLMVGYLLGYWNHGLALRREAQKRRRHFRDRMRELLIQVENCHWHRLYGTHRDAIGKVQTECAAVVEDVAWWKRAKFNRNLEKFYGIESGWGPAVPRPQSPAEVGPYREAEKNKHQKIRRHLAEALKGLIQCAK